MLDSITLQDFQPYVGARFTLFLDGDTPRDCELAELKRYGEQQAGALEAPAARAEAFAVVFRTSANVALAQGMYTLSHAAFGTLEGLFLVPVGMDANGRYYEAVFN